MCIRLVALLLLLTACSTASNQPSQRVSQLGERHYDSFDTAETNWDTFVIPGDQALFRVHDGILEGAVVGNRGYIWSLNGLHLQDTIIEATVRQTQGSTGNGFGVLCRADADGNGYYFVISSAGQFAILKATATAADPLPLVPWQEHVALQRGLETNHLQIACVGNYLSFFANGQFLAEARDSEFSQGQTGLVIGATGQTAWVGFDDIRIYDAATISTR